MARLTAKAVEKAGVGRHGDGEGLYLVVKPPARLSPNGSRSWVLRIQRDGRRRDIGLGKAVASATDLGDEVPFLHRRVLSLADARKKAAILREFTKAGRDPFVERDRDRGGIPTFEAAAKATYDALKSNWVEKNAAAFLSSLGAHAYPTLGQLRVDQIEASHIGDMLRPIWNLIPETARKVRMRVGMVLNFSHAKGWRATEAPGRSVSLGLSRQSAGRNFAAMPFAEVPGFVSETAAKPQTSGRMALLFAIYTAARSGEVRSARWSHIDLERRLWSRPAELMKMREPHVVTLNEAAIELLRRLEGDRVRERDDLIFLGRSGVALSDMTLTKVLRDANSSMTTHGFRSSFRDWAAECMPTIPDPVAEAALAHSVADKVERAYKRTPFIELRRTLLKEWGRFLTGGAAELHAP